MVRTPVKQFPSKNAVAINVLTSWLKAVGIPVIPASEGFDLTVLGKDSKKVDVIVAVEGEVRSTGLKVLAKDVTGRQEGKAYAAFHKITEAAGQGSPIPLDRGGGQKILNEKGNPRKLCYRDEDFLVTIRHNEFRRSPNPSPAAWRQYQRAMNWIVGKFYFKNTALCERQKMELEDVMQYARCFMVNFCARYERPDATPSANEGLFMEYLRQRLSGLHQIMLKKELSIIPDADSIHMALGGLAMEYHPSPADAYQLALDHPKELAEARAIFRGEKEGEIPELFTHQPVDQEYLDRNCELDTSSLVRRRASARAKLNEMLNALPHKQFLSVLNNVADDVTQDFTARKEAFRRIRSHTKSCKLCNLGVKKEKEMPSTNTLGA